ncbi:hypothetical protein RD792_011484 [Penstemon davidsonii]|uniref:Protein kinase domain-containing protein n=1 Tax=Penstemon davidsonii TaxID=160366 RepID=A0ABR0D636_9LAMI|nr:hypothetical protein RD792_011484 [Penstemon davidsonii]
MTDLQIFFEYWSLFQNGFCNCSLYSSAVLSVKSHLMHLADPRPGKIGRYKVGRTIGEGTFAKVKFARNSENREPVAIKILDKDKVLKHKMAEQVLARKTKIFIILEFVTGGELFDKIVNDGRMREDEARKYFQQLIHAVDYCHSRGVFHRDLKPENLLLDVAGNLKVFDFGLSALAQQVRISSAEFTCPPWLSFGALKLIARILDPIL